MVILINAWQWVGFPMLLFGVALVANRFLCRREAELS